MCSVGQFCLSTVLPVLRAAPQTSLLVLLTRCGPHSEAAVQHIFLPLLKCKDGGDRCQQFQDLSCACDMELFSLRLFYSLIYTPCKEREHVMLLLLLRLILPPPPPGMNEIIVETSKFLNHLVISNINKQHTLLNRCQSI